MQMIELYSEDNLKVASRQYMGVTRAQLCLSLSKIQRLLRSDLPNVNVLGIEGFPLGGPNELYRIVLEDSKHQMALKIVNKGAESGHDGYLCAREIYALQRASESSLPVPRVYAGHPDGGELGRPYFVMECLPGQPLLMEMKVIPLKEIENIGREVGEAIGSLHKITFTYHGDLPVPYEFTPVPHYKPLTWGMSGELFNVFQRRVDFILALYAEQNVLSPLDVETLTQVFHGQAKMLLQTEQTASLAQMDLAAKNILISERKGKRYFSGIVDFDRSLALPPEAELGVMENRWLTNADEQRMRIYASFYKGFLEGYSIDEVLMESWKRRKELFCALESLERVYTKSARTHLSQYIDCAEKYHA